jgi:hypothetical protein
MRKASYLMVALIPLVLLPASACRSHPKGMESLRWLTDGEKDKAIETALNTHEAMETSEKYGVTRTSIGWVAVEWRDGGAEFYGFDYEMMAKVPGQVPETVEFYVRVEIYFGEPERVLLRVTINPDTGKVAHIQSYPLKTLPSG